jgi:hypothetical protein
MSVVVFTSAAFALAQQQPGKWWQSVIASQSALNSIGLQMATNNNVICYWTPTCNRSSALVVISCPEVFTTTSDRNALTASRRIAKLMRIGTVGGRMSPDLGPMRHGNLISCFAYNYAAGQQKIIAEARPLGTADFYVYDFGLSGGRDLSSSKPDYAIFQDARVAAVQMIPSVPAAEGPWAVDLGPAYEKVGSGIASKITWQAWERRLNEQQRAFVDMKFDQPIRLRGAAGTGKTLTLAIKAMKLLYTAMTGPPPQTCRILFLTHSWALAEAADELMDDLDPARYLRRDGRSIDVWPLLTLADSRVRLGGASRRLLGADSRAGKIEMHKRLNGHLNAYLQGNWITRRSGCTAEFVSRIEAADGTPQRQSIVWDIMIEFATVFAAAGIHPRRRHDYFRLPRRKWMLELKTDSEKETIADLYQVYFEGLQADGLTGPEQLVADYLKALSTFELGSPSQDRGI